MATYIFDIETDGLEGTKIHCLSYRDVDKDVIKTLHDYEDMRRFFKSANCLIGHNIILFDIPEAERLLGINIDAVLIDTLAISWYLDPLQKVHGLEYYGETFGFPKVVIHDWENQSKEDYTERCERDVLINYKLWDRQLSNLLKLYESKREAYKIIKYLTFKLSCVRLQEKSRWKLDVEACIASLERLSHEKEEKVQTLKEVMPNVPIKAKRKKPKILYKKDGSLSSHGQKWKELTEEKGLPLDYEGEIEVVKGFDEPNPNSTSQVKDWLFSKGWKPQTFNFVKDDDGSTRRIPQINKPFGEGICDSIKILFDKEPALQELDGISVISHRIGQLKGFLRDVDSEGYLKAQVAGVTNTLRFRHKTIVNLPGVKKPYGEDIRGCLVAPEGYELCGSDMSSLEDRTKQHYMWDYDPQFVREMQTPDFDPHLDLCIAAGVLTEQQVQNHKDGTEDHGKLRHLYKTANYSAIYGVGAKKLALTTGKTESECQKILDTYWKRNWSVKRLSKSQTVKKCLGKMWLLNPVSGFWYSLRAEKDIFSTLNQGTGVFCFDLWIKNILAKRPQLTGQMHDEIILTVKKGHRKEVEELLRACIKETNEQLRLNRDLGIDIQFGDSYAEIH